jgi:23S rRNA A1618 N6-methylase RlmF
MKENEIPNGNDPYITENIQAQHINPNTLFRRMRPRFSSGLQIAKYCVVANPSMLSVLSIPNDDDTNDPAIMYNRISQIPEWCNATFCRTDFFSKYNTLLQSHENKHDNIFTTVRFAYCILYTDFPCPRLRVRQNKVNAKKFKVIARTARKISIPKRQGEK